MKKSILLMTMAFCGLTCFGQTERETWTYGNHTYTQKGTLTAKKYDGKAKGVVTFTNVPSDYEEFEALYTEFLGKTPHGTAAMMVMAMEIYGRDRQVGRQCIELINYPSNVNSVIPRLNDKYGTSQYAPENDSYHQRYLPAAVLKGATPQNGYRPQEPYTVEMKASVNKHQELQIVGSGRVMYLYVMGKGWDTEQRSVEIIQQPGQPLYKVFNCPALYTQCKTIQGSWQGLKQAYLLKYFITPAFLQAFLYHPEYQLITKLRFWAKETGTFKAVNSDFTLTKPPEISLFSPRKNHAVQ